MAAAAIPLILGGLSGLAGLFGGKPKQTTGKSDTTTNASGTYSSTTTPELSQLQQALANLFSNQAIQRATQDPNLEGYQRQGIETINKGADLQSKAVANILAARGQTFSPLAGTSLASPESARISQISQFKNSIPLLARQLQSDDLSNLIKSFSVLPTATSTSGQTQQQQTSHTDQTGTVSGGGGMLGGLFSGLGAGLAAPSGGTNASGGSLSNLAQILQSFGLGGK